MKNSVVCCAIFKNESHVLDEWISHYISEGVDHFLLIDNGSTDNYSKIIDRYKNIITLFIDDTKHAQTKLYNLYFLDHIKDFSWNIVCDLDEFIYAKNNFLTIKDYLSTVDDTVNQVYIPWKMFGSSGLLDQPSSVRKSFTKRALYSQQSHHHQGGITPGYNLVKTICRSSKVFKLGIHSSIIEPSREITSDGRNINYTTINNKPTVNFQAISEEIITISNLNLNHYAIQSKNWFMDVKSTRGAADSQQNENIRNIEYFHSYDRNDIEDLELAKKYE